MPIVREAGRFGSERGAIFAMIAIALFVFTLMSAVVVDYGLQLVSRNQIQTAVDAAALAGATALAFDSYKDQTDEGPAFTIAAEVAKNNLVWGSGELPAEISFPYCPRDPAEGATAPFYLACISVTAYRDKAHENKPIPALFGPLLGVSAYETTATAKARAVTANTTDCLRPIAVPDRWSEVYPAPGPWLDVSTYDRYPPPPAPPAPPPTPDDYRPPVAWGGDTGTSVTNDDQFGTLVKLRAGSLGSPTTIMSPWRYLPLQISAVPDPVFAHTRACARRAIRTGADVDIAPGAIPDNAARFIAGLEELVALDGAAHWDADTLRVVDSCVETTQCASISPRIIAIGLYDPAELAAASLAGVPTRVVIRNFVGFFVDSIDGTDVTGYITRYPGLRDPGAALIPDDSSFLRAAVLIQ